MAFFVAFPRIAPKHTLRYFIGFTFAQIGFGGVFTMTTLVLVAGALTVLALGIRTSGKTLEQIVAEESGIAQL